MKKIILSAMMALVALSGIDAQNYKWWAGGRSAFWSGDDGVTFTFAPEVGYHLSSKFTIASSVGIHANNYKDGKDAYGLVLNPYVRYTAFKQGILLGFVDGGVDFGLGDIEGFQLGFKPGVALLLTDRFTVATQFGFIGYSDDKRIGGRREGLGFDLSGYCSTIAFFYSF